MTSTVPVRLGVSGARHLVHVVWLVCLSLGACLLPSLVAPQTAHADTVVLVFSTPGPRAEVVDGVPLIPTTKEQRSECERFAQRLHRPVPCPGLLPDPIPITSTNVIDCLGDVGAIGEGSCGPAGIELNGKLFLLSQANFQVPPGYVGVSYEQYSGAMAPETSISGGPLGHFVFMSGTDLQTVMTGKRGKGVAPVPSYCTPLDSSGLTHVHGSRAQLYQCADSRTANSQTEIIVGHTVLVWNDAGITTEVSFHGHSQVNVDLDVAVAKATFLVSP